MQRRGKERSAKFEKSPSLKPASLKFRFATLFPAEEAGEGHRTALCATLHRVLATPGRAVVREQNSLCFPANLYSHTAHSK